MGGANENIFRFLYVTEKNGSNFYTSDYMYKLKENVVIEFLSEFY